MTETYSKSADFGNQVALGQFHVEVVADVAITTTLLRVDGNGDVVDVVFESTISGAEKTALDADVAAHVPSPRNSIDSVAGYIELNSSLADNGALRLVASNVAGGIDIDAGTGGITIDTTNAISLDAAAASNFTTTVGNLTLDATTGLVNIDGGSGINIGSKAEAQPINIGTGAAARMITIGNTTSTTTVDIDTGTGGFIVDTASGGGISLDATGASCNFTLASTGDAQDLTIALTGANNSSIVIDSAGTGVDAIRFNSAGGIDIDTAGQYNVNTSSTAANAFRFSCAGAGGFDMDLGSSGFDLDTTGPINLATSEGAGGSITLDAATNNGGITLSSGSQGIGINSGTGLIGIGHVSAGNMDIGTSATARTMRIGNSTGATRMFNRFGTGGLIKSQAAPTSLSDANATLTIAQLLSPSIFYMTPTVDRTLTLPTAALAVAGISGVEIGDSIDFSFISETTNNVDMILAMGTGGTLLAGNSIVRPAQQGQHYGAGAGWWRLRFTNVSSEAYQVFRLA